MRTAWPVLVICLMVGLAAGWLVSIATPKVYRATAELYASAPPGTAAGSSGEETVVVSLASFATSPAVTVPVIRQLNLQLTAVQLANKISADTPSGTVLINLHVTDRDAMTAARMTNAVAASFITTVRKVEPTARLSMVRPATVPAAPISPNRSLDIWLGGLAGLVVGLIGFGLIGFGVRRRLVVVHDAARVDVVAGS